MDFLRFLSVRLSIPIAFPYDRFLVASFTCLAVMCIYLPFYFGDIKTAQAKEDGVVKYEVVYVEIKDNLVKGKDESVSSSIKLRSAVAKPMIGPRASSTNATTDYDVYEVTTDGGLSFSTSGSKVRYANQLSADLGFITHLYPNAVANMRTRMKT